MDSRGISEVARFEWQDGYGAFTVSNSQIPDVITYIENQHEHHRKRSLQKEYLELLKKMVSITMNVTCGIDSGVAKRRVTGNVGVTGLKRPA